MNNGHWATKQVPTAAAIKRRKSWVITPVMMIVAAKNRVQFREEASRENFLGKAKEHFLFIRNTNLHISTIMKLICKYFENFKFTFD